MWASIGLDTLPKVARAYGIPLAVNKQDKFFTTPGGSEIWLAGLDEKERTEKILGMEFATVYENEASQIPYSSSLILQTRLAQNIGNLRQRHFVDLNPGPTGHWTNRLFIQKVDPETTRPIPNPDDYAHIFLNPRDNAANLSPEYLQAMERLPERQRKRFYDGVYQNEIDGALWPLEVLDRCRCDLADVPQDLVRVVVAIDPSGTAGKGDKRGDSVGIIVAGKGRNGKAYVLADRTCNLSPAGWARVAIKAYHDFSADCIVAERNFGGAMVEHTIRVEDSIVKFREVTASRGKALRAEPVAALYERGMVHHVARFAELEDQMANFSTAGYLGDKSPDRADALVWALSELMLDKDRFDLATYMKAFS